MEDMTLSLLEVVDEDAPKTVAQLLSEVDYGEDPNYIPSAFAIKVINFIKLMTDGEGESSPTPVMHYKMMDLLQHESDDMRFQRIAELAARGTAKTSMHSEILFFYIAVFGEIDNFGPVDAIIYISDTVENGVKSLKKNMEARYWRSNFLQEYLPEVVFNQNEIYLTNIDGRSTGIRMFGAQSGLRGVKIFGKRPQLGVMDDVLSDKNAKSDGIVESINDMLYKGLDQALDPTQRKIIFAGTPFDENDPLYVAIESGAWQSHVFPICEKFPCTREEFKGSWEARFTYDHIKSQYNALKAAQQLPAFYQELMLQINSDETKLVDDSDINWFNRSDVFANKDKYYFYITTDFATSSAKSSDNSAISVWAVNHQGYTFWVDGILQQQAMDKNIEDLFRLARMYSPRSVGIEINGQQAGFIPWIKQKMVTEDCFFPLARTLSTTGDTTSRIGILSSNQQSKLERFNIMVPDVKAGKLYLPLDMITDPIIKEVLLELRGVTSHGIVSRRDDWLDTYAMLGAMRIIRPSESGLVEVDTANTTGNTAYDNFWGDTFNNQLGASSGSSYYV